MGRNSLYNPVMKKVAALGLACLVFTACSSGEPQPQGDSVGISPDSTGAALADSVARATASRKEAWIVSEAGIGPIRAGMSVEESRGLLPGLRTAEGSGDLASAPCTYARSQSLPPGVVLMFENGRIARVDILTGSSRTVEGAGIGDTEARLQSLYPDRLATTPHKYADEGHYLTVPSKSDSTYKIVFETDGYKVLRFRSGKTPAVDYVEGCG